MLGAVHWEGNCRGVRISQQTLAGLPVIWAAVRPGGWGEGLRLERAARLLEKHGVKRLLRVRDFESWEVLARRGLCPVDALALYRSMAPSFVLAALERSGVQPCRGTVALRAERIGPELERTARLLCPRVRTLIIDSRAGGERLAKELYLTFGAAVRVGNGGGADAAVCFDGPARDGEIGLGPRAVCLRGLRVTAPGTVLPDELEPESALCALWQAGRLTDRDLHVTF